MRLSKFAAAGLTCLLISLTILSGCGDVTSPPPTTTAPVTVPTTAPTVAPTEDDGTRIGKDAYNGSDMEAFTLDAVIAYIDEGAFANCHQLKSFHCASMEVDIHENAFSGSENVVFYCYLDSSIDLFAREHGYERIYYNAFSVQCDTVTNGCVGLPITWSAVDVMPGQEIESQFVYTLYLNDEPVFTSEPTAEDSFTYTPEVGGMYALTVEMSNDLTTSSISGEAIPVADKLIMGYYEQDNDETATEAVEWRILTVEDGKALVISEKILDMGSYFNPEWIKYKYTYWANSCIGETSSINYWGSAPESADRRFGGLSPESVPLTWYGEYGPETELFYVHCRYWCNEFFYKNAFSDEEKERILLSDLTNPDNPNYGTPGGPDSQDYVFFLSYEEVNAYLPTSADRIAQYTPYGSIYPYPTGVYYWLRTPGICQFNAAYVHCGQGYIEYYGSDVGHDTLGYRPAMWITVGG